MRVYIAGPYAKGDVAVNVRNAIGTADLVLDLGHIPYVPHLIHFWHLLHPHPHHVWLALDRKWLLLCDAVFRLPGKSIGADMEVKLAKSLGLPIYYNLDEVPKCQDSLT